MKKYISLDVLVAEVEKRRDKNTRNKLNLAAAFEDNYLLSFLNSLEVKEIQEQPTSNELKTESYWENKYKEVLKQLKKWIIIYEKRRRIRAWIISSISLTG